MSHKKRVASRAVDEKFRNRRTGTLSPVEVLHLLREHHAEVHVHSVSGEEILVSCECKIGHDHSYTEWVDIVGGELYKGVHKTTVSEASRG